MYGLAVLAFLAIVIGVPSYFIFFNKQPTCFDGKQNGTETGIDCGGACASVRACVQDVLPQPIVMWSRPFSVARGLHNLVAYVQNPNVNYTAQPIEYLFRVYDVDNVLLGTREGYAMVPPTKAFPIFEAAFDAGERQPAKAVFEFTQPAVWKQFETSVPELVIYDEILRNASSSPRIDAMIQNKTINRYRDIEVVAVIYDEKGNARAASRTLVDVLPGSESRPLIFTWPEPFDFQAVKIEIIPKLPI